MSKKTFLATAAVAVAALGLAGCSAATPTGSDDEKSEPKNIVYVVPSSWANAGSFQENIDAYEAESGNTVEVQAVPDEQFTSTVQARLASGEGIDVFPGYNDIDDPGSVLVEIENPSYEDRMSASVFDSIKAKDGKIYGYPTATPLSTFGVFYNKDVFEAAGVEVPTTLDEMTEAFEAIKADGVTPLYLAGKDGWTLLQHRNSVNAGFFAADADVATKLATNETEWQEVDGFDEQYTALAEWSTSGLINDNALTASYEESQRALVDGQAGAIINGSWVIGELRKLNPDANIGFFALPTAEGEAQIALTPPNVVHIAASSEVKEEAEEMLQFLIEPEQVELFMASAPGVPAFTDVEIAEVDPAMADVLVYVDAEETGPHFDAVTRFPNPEAEFIAAYQELIAGRIDVKEFGASVQSAWVTAGQTAGIEGF